MRIAALALLLLAATPAAAEDAMIPAAESAQHIGTTGTVVGVLSSVHKSDAGKYMYLDLGGLYPDQAFSAVIFTKNMHTVPDFTPLVGKTVAITGLIKLYHGKPEIIVNSSDQIKVAH